MINSLFMYFLNKKIKTIVDTLCINFLADCYVCDDCQGAGTLSTCTGSTPYCLNHYSNSQWGVSHVSKRWVNG